MKKVKGIGEGIFGKLKDEATVGAAVPAKMAKPAAAKPAAQPAAGKNTAK